MVCGLRGYRHGLTLGVVSDFRLGGREVADRFEQPAMIEPIDPFEGGKLDGFESAPRPAPMDHLGLEQILLMDEPIGALDAQARIILQDELLKLWHERRQTVLFVTHDIGEAITMADKVIVMTARPATIKTEYDIDLPRPRSAADVWFDRRFADIYKAIWNDLRPEIDRQTHIVGQP